MVDSRRYLVDAVTMARIVDAQKFRETVGADLARAEDRIRTPSRLPLCARPTASALSMRPCQRTAP